MRELTDSERAAMDAARNELLEGIDPDSIKPIIAISAAHRSGFIAGLDHSAAQIAALEAENARLREALKPFIALWPNDLGKFDDKPIYGNTNATVNVGHIRAARAALDNT